MCAGCLCLDPAWSCDEDSWLAADGGVVELRDEAGFLELEEHCFEFEGETRCVEPARMWYAFQPADEDPETKPLAVFFNGVPMWAESGKLFAHNTASRTLDPAFTGGAPFAANPHSWTRFANVLYPDPRHAGFSYARGGPFEWGPPSSPILLEQESADVVRFLLRFLGRHPQLRGTRVIIVAESFAGVRAAILLEMLLHHERLAEPAGRYVDLALHEEIRQHLGAVSPEGPGAPLGPAQVARQFGHQVLIQPLVAGQRQLDAAEALKPEQCDCLAAGGCLDASDNCDTAVVNGLLDPTVLSGVTGVDARTIAWLGAPARADAHRLVGTSDCMAAYDAQPMIDALGALGENDAYFVYAADSGYVEPDRPWEDHNGYRFLANAQYVRTFMTNAAKDPTLCAPAIPVALATFDDAVSDVVYDSAAPAGAARPGTVTIHYQPDWIGSDDTVREIRFPTYPESGHMVPAWQPAEILEDVRAWYLGER